LLHTDTEPAGRESQGADMNQHKRQNSRYTKTPENIKKLNITGEIAKEK